jgi:hypothetical protein
MKEMRPVTKTAKPPPHRNKILAALPGKEYRRVLPYLIPISMGMGETLYETEDSIKRVYFPNQFEWME